MAASPKMVPPDAATVERFARQNFQEYLELLSLPNIPDKARDMQANAAFLERLFKKRGFATQLLMNAAERPVVFAQLGKVKPGARTVLFYAHFDGQPVIPKDWAQHSPFEPVVKQRNDRGEWHEVSRDALFAPALDRELRVFARSSSDDKAPIMMLLTAIDLLTSRQALPDINVKVLLDPEEEISSPNLAAVVKANQSLFAADAMVLMDGPLHASGRPTLVFGNRGLAQTTLTVYGPRSPLHSGHFGNYVPNPAQRLAALLASMKDEAGRVQVAGYYDGIDLTAADREVLAQTGDDEAALLRRTGIAKPESVGRNYQESLQYPSLNVRGMAAGAIGDQAANILPSEAIAELDLRVTPEKDGRQLYELVKRHIEKQGYHLVVAAPTDEERAKYDKIARFELSDAQAAQRIAMDTPVGKWAFAALKSSGLLAADENPVRIRMMGGTLPTDVLVEALGLPFILVPTVNADNNQHARDENMRIGNFVTGTQTILSLLTTKFGK